MIIKHTDIDGTEKYLVHQWNALLNDQWSNDITTAYNYTKEQANIILSDYERNRDGRRIRGTYTAH